jgi:hypothetical protein
MMTTAAAACGPPPYQHVGWYLGEDRDTQVGILEEEAEDKQQQQPESVPKLNKMGLQLSLLTCRLGRLTAVSIG